MVEIHSKLSKTIEQIVKEQFTLGDESPHGVGHWRRVEEIGLYLSRETLADVQVVTLFAFLHDSRRQNEDHDPEHGPRAAQYVRQLSLEGLLPLQQEQLNQLVFACQHHSNPKIKTSDPTIQTCWDSDRLDLWRLDITPDPAFLNTEIAKRKEARIFSLELLKQAKES